MRLLVPLLPLLLLVGAAHSAGYVPPWEQVSFQSKTKQFNTKPWFTTDVGNRFCPGGNCNGIAQLTCVHIGCGSTGKYEGRRMDDMNLRWLAYNFYTVEPLDSKNNVLRVINGGNSISQIRETDQKDNMLWKSDTFAMQKPGFNTLMYNYWKSASNAKYNKPPTAKGINAGYLFFGKNNYFGDGYVNFQYTPEKDKNQMMTQQREFPVSYASDITMLDKDHPFYIKKFTMSVDGHDSVVEIPIGVDKGCESDYDRWINSYGAYVYYYSGKPSEGSDFRQIYYFPDINSYPFLT